MQWIAAIGGTAFILASLLVGGRLLWLAWRNRGLTEFVLGAGLFLMGGVSYPVVTVAVQATGLDMGVRVGLLVFHALCNGLGMTGIAWFTLHVFQRGQRWPWAIVALTFLCYAGTFAAQIVQPGLPAYLADGSGPYQWAVLGAILAPIYAGSEALRYHAQLRRRQRLGMADPVLTDRFRLWAMAMLLAATLTILARTLDLIGISTQGTVAGALLVGPLGLAISACLWLAFFPPSAYVERVRTRAATPA